MSNESSARDAVESIIGIEHWSRRKVLGTGGAAAAVTMTSSMFGSMARAQGNDTLVAAFSRDFATFDPAAATTATSIAVNTHVLEPLMEISFVDRSIGLGLAAAKPEMIDDVTYRVSIRDGATFHNGAPVTSEDVVFSYDLVLNPENNSFFSQFVDFIDSVAAVDDSTVEFKLKHPTGGFVDRLIVVKIVPKAVMEEIGREAYGLAPVGSGPFTFVEARNNDRIELARYDAYNGPNPGNVANISFRIQVDGPSRVSALRAGQVHVSEDPSDRDLPVLAEVDGIDVASEPSFTMQFLMFNCKNPMFTDKRVRQALHWAIDREKILNGALLGNAKIADSYLPEGHKHRALPETVYSLDLDKARTLLAEAGFGDGLKFTMQVFESTWVETTAAIIQQDWKKIGVEINLLVGGESIYDNVFDGSYEAQLALADQSLFGYDAGTLLGWHYGRLWAEQLYYWTGPERDRMDELLAAAFQASGDEQAQLYAEVQTLANNEVPIAALHHRNTNTAWRSDAVAGFQPIRTLGLDVRSASRIA